MSDRQPVSNGSFLLRFNVALWYFAGIAGCWLVLTGRV